MFVKGFELEEAVFEKGFELEDDGFKLLLLTEYKGYSFENSVVNCETTFTYSNLIGFIIVIKY